MVHHFHRGARTGQVADMFIVLANRWCPYNVTPGP